MTEIERPSWHSIWMSTARQLALRSPDPTARVGTVIVSSDNSSILALGYNGNAKGLQNARDSDEPGGSNFIHAEQNALYKLDYHNSIPKIMYVTLSPCLMCAKGIIQCNISAVVYSDTYRITDGLDLLCEAGIKVGQWKTPEDDLKIDCLLNS